MILDQYKLIGIAGFARTGKDSLASMIKFLLEEDSHKCKISSFAQHLKKDLDSLSNSGLNNILNKNIFNFTIKFVKLYKL